MNLLLTNLHLARLPLFPLPGTVFFPNTLLPLHVFEPRYRALTQHCIDRQWPLAVVLIEPGHEGEQAGTPPLAQLAGIGHLVMHDRLTDGRFNIMVQGLSRVQILEELPPNGSGYRTARAQLVSDYVHPDRELLLRKTHSVRSALTSLVARDRKIAQMVSEPLFGTRSPAVLADALSALVFVDPAKRQELLANTRVHERLDQVLVRLTDLLALSSLAGAFGAGSEVN
ncbi:MAG: LON peptidase substrate-binding domain-containing protein [bacterium]